MKIYWRDDWPIYASGAVFALVIALMFWAEIYDSKQWTIFAAEHSCKVVGHMRGDTFNTFGVDGKGNPVVGIGSTPDKTGYLCDDGVTYWR